jgi:L-fuconate dehydratase
MTGRITGMRPVDVRFPTSRQLDGSDAMNPAPDYSAAYVTLSTDEGRHGHAFAFTLGRGNEVQVEAIRALERAVVGTPVDEILTDLGGFSRRLLADSPLRWLGPEKGVMHMAIGAVVNAAWDLRARIEGKPLWRSLADLEPDAVVDLVDFRYLRDVLDRDEALDLLRRAAAGKAARVERLLAEGVPAYSTSPGWLGYADDKLARLCAEAVEEGFDLVKLKVGGSVDDDVRRCRIAREVLGPDRRLAVDANQIWDVDQAIDWIRRLAAFDLHWVEEPTSPDDVTGHAAIRAAVAPVRIATGEHVQNRVVFKQLMARAAIDVVQIDAARVAGVNENVAVILLAAKFGLPVCPHAGGVGLCEMVQHLSMFDYVALGGDLDDRVVEHVGHLHEHFHDPVRLVRGRYLAPSAPGFSTAMLPASIEAHRFPDGAVWRAAQPGNPSEVRG